MQNRVELVSAYMIEKLKLLGVRLYLGNATSLSSTFQYWTGAAEKREGKGVNPLGILGYPMV